jgi:hypothetical protein
MNALEDGRTRTISFLPWLRISAPVSIGRFTFTPFLDDDDQTTAALREIGDAVRTVLSGYVDLRGTALRNCVMILNSELTPSWDLPPSSLGDARWAAVQLFLVTFSMNEYFEQVRQYANSSMFTVYHQSFTLPIDFIAVNSRRRDGSLMIGGYRHGEMKFTVPVYADTTGEFRLLDSDLLAALERAASAGSTVLSRLRPALSFLSLASTDSDAMSQDAEIILMISAYEQLLAPSETGARHLALALSLLLERFGSVSVDSALKNRPGIEVNAKYEKEQRGWPVHRKWMEELYQLRNAYAHGDATNSRTWGWLPLEHLVMAALVFPLSVKLLLEAEGHYRMTRRDEIMGTALGGLLGQSDWLEPAEKNPNNTRWHETLRNAASANRVARAVRSWQEKQS